MTAAEAWQTWLSLEHEAVWWYPVAGARFDELRDAAVAAFEAHRDVRDTVLSYLESTGRTPESTQLSYGIDESMSRADARRRSRELEARIAAACLSVVGLVEGDDRGRAITGLTRAALAQIAWGAEPRAFPGLP